MININLSTMIYKPPQQVFEYVTNPENDFQWQYGTLATGRLSEGVSAIGTFFRSIGHFMGRRMLSAYEVTEYEPNRKYGFRSLSGLLHTQTSYTFETTNDGTRITISTRAHAINFPQMNERVLGNKLKKQLKENLTALKELLEEKASSLETYPLAV